MITMLVGENSFMVGEARRRLVSTFTAAHGDINYEQIDASEAEYSRIVEAVTSMPFLSEEKLVVVYQFTACKELTEQFDAFTKAHNDTTQVVLVDSKLDKRTSFYKQLQKLDYFNEFNVLDERALLAWLQQAAKVRGGFLSAQDARLLLSLVGDDQALLSNELQKLITYNVQVTAESIRLLVEPIPQSTVFQLVEALFLGDIANALRIYEQQRRQRVEPQAIMGMIAWQLHIIALAVAAGNKPLSVVAKQAKVSPYPLQKAQSLSWRLSKTSLRELLEYVRDADVKMKSHRVNADQLLQQVFFWIAQKVA